MNITSKTRLTEAEIRASGAARTLQRRMRARQLYRQRRDRKIAVDWLGREFDWKRQGRIQLTGYNPDGNSVRFQFTNYRDQSHFIWSTDQFWFNLRTGRLVPA